MIMDTFESLRPKTKLFTSLEEAQNAVAELNKEYEEKISKIYLGIIHLVRTQNCPKN